jgi:hypothetical protein
MSRIQARFAELQAQGRKALIPFITAGDPEPGQTLPLMQALVIGRLVSPGSEVHTYNCTHGPADHNRTYLGDFASCAPAVTEAKKTYRQSNGCYYCANSCHTS